MFDRLTLPARKVMAKARSECFELKHSLVSTQHILLGLICVESSIQKELQAAGLEYENLRNEVKEWNYRWPSGTPAARLPFSAGAKKLLEGAVKNAEVLHTINANR